MQTRPHDELVRRRDLPGAPGEAEGVDHEREQRAELVPAPPRRRDPVGRAHRCVGRARRQREARHAQTVVDELRQHQQRCADERPSLDRHAAVGADVHPRRVRGAPDGELRSRPEDEHVREQEEQQAGEPEADERAVLQDDRPDRDAAGTTQERPAASSGCRSSERRRARAHPDGAGDGHVSEHRVDDVDAGDPAQAGFGRDDHAVLEDRRCEELDVIRDHIVAPLRRRERAAARCSASAPRGLAPSVRSGCDRVASATSTM